MRSEKKKALGSSQFPLLGLPRACCYCLPRPYCTQLLWHEQSVCHLNFFVTGMCISSELVISLLQPHPSQKRKRKKKKRKTKVKKKERRKMFHAEDMCIFLHSATRCIFPKVSMAPPLLTSLWCQAWCLWYAAELLSVALRVTWTQPTSIALFSLSHPSPHTSVSQPGPFLTEYPVLLYPQSSAHFFLTVHSFLHMSRLSSNPTNS